jgi:hypothetical protein
VYAPVSASTIAREVPALGWVKRKTYSRFPPSLWSFSDLIFASGTFASTIFRAESAVTLGAGCDAAAVFAVVWCFDVGC